MGYATRPPTGAQPWPILLLAGVDHAVVVDACAEAATSPLIGRALWLTIGRDQPDHLDPSAVDLVEHDGTYRDILGAARWATAQPIPDIGALLLVVDTVSAFRAMLTDQAGATATERGFPPTEAGIVVPHDLWRDRDQRWHRFVNTIRRHPGPVLLTAYVDEVALANEKGDRTTSTRWELQADKNLARTVTATVQWRPRPVITGLGGHDDTPADDVTIADVWGRLGITETTPPVPRDHSFTIPLSQNAERARLFAQVGEAAAAAGVPREEVAAGWANSHNGQPINHPDVDLDELERVRDALLADAAARAETTS